MKETPDSEKTQWLKRAFVSAMKPERYLRLDEWSDLYRVLPRETSDEHGQWSTDRFPFLRLIMRLLSPDSRCRQIVVCKGCQLGFTEVMLCWFLYIADMCPAPTLYTQATEGAVEDFSKQKLAPSILACWKVAHLLGPEKPRSLSNTMFDKGFPGGMLALGPANSEKFTRSKSARNAGIDEEDSYALSGDNAGAPVANIAKRQVNFAGRKMFRVSTPKIRETSTIEPAFEMYTQERFYVPCPHCNPKAEQSGFMFVIQWDSIKWSDKIDPVSEVPDAVWLECPRCAGRIEEHEKTWMLMNGDWYSEKNSEGTRYTVPDEVEDRSFHISSLYSPYGFFSWRDAVKEWFAYRKTNDRNLLQVFINQTLGETYTLEGQEVSFHYLQSRAEEYGEGFTSWEVPLDGLVLTCGVDIQADRIECEVVAWGMHDENWSIDYKVFPGDTSMLGDARGITADGQPSVWLMLDQYLTKRFKHQSGNEMPIECTMIDTGYASENVHVFCRLREQRRVFPLKGRQGWGFGFFQANHRRHERFGTVTYTAYVDELKAKLYGMLQVEQHGPGFCHFPRRYGEVFFKGLVSESRKVKMVNGQQVLKWEKAPGARNEPLDCRNYAYVARVAYPVDLGARHALVHGSSVQPAQQMPVMMRRRNLSKGL